MFRRSQTFTVLSSDPDTMCSVLEKAALVTDSVCPWNTETACIASLKSHSLKVESLLLVTTSLLEGWQAAPVSSMSWPGRVWTMVAELMSQRAAVLSQLAVTAWSPPASQSALTTTPW